MKKLISILIFCLILIIGLYMVIGDIQEWVEINLNSKDSLITYTLLSFTLLLSDIVLPVPSSLVMILNGKILGVFPGTALSLVSGVCSSSIGFYLGRKSNPFLEKMFNKHDNEISHKLFNKFGNMAITLSKALPIISEAVSFVSGTTTVSFKTFLMYSIAGHFVVSAIYAYVGSASTVLNSNIVAVIMIITSLLAGWVIQAMIRRKATVTE